MNDAAAGPAASRTPGLHRQALELLGDEERARLARVKWHDRLVSLWAPLTVLALLFLVYLVFIELWVCSSVVLQPVMQVLGVLTFTWWVGLVVARLALKEWNRDRARRYHGDEVVAEVARVADRNRGQLKGKGWTELTQGTAALFRGYLAGTDALKESVERLEQAQATHLARFKGSGALDFGSGFIKALVVALVFRAVAIEPYKIPSGSMIPTLQIGDQVFVNKFLYGVRLPFTNYVPFVLVRPPARGDVIVFNNPASPQDDYIKRVMGVPGDVLEFTEAGVTVNGAALARTVVDPGYRYWDVSRAPYRETVGDMLRRWVTDDWREREDALYREVVDGRPHYILDDPRSAPATLARQLERRVVVPPRHVFVLGDNRNNSEDSRFGLSDQSNRPRFVPYGHIKGKAMVIWLSLARGGLFSSVFGGTGLRYDRFFRPVSVCEGQPPP